MKNKYEAINEKDNVHHFRGLMIDFKGRSTTIKSGTLWKAFT